MGVTIFAREARESLTVARRFFTQNAARDGSNE
jgi:hypothetical protein